MRFPPFGTAKVDSEVFVDVQWADPDVAKAMENIDLALVEVSTLPGGSRTVDLLLDARLDLLGVRP